MFEELIEEGRKRVARLEKYMDVPLEEIPLEERMGSSEIAAWFTVSSDAVIEVFGNDSRQSEKWRELRMEQRGLSGYGRNEAYSSIIKIHELMGLLTEFAIVQRTRATADGKLADGNMNAAPFAFISYAHEDSLIADEIAAVLSDLEIEFFLDKKDIRWGESIGERVRSALRRSTHQIIILSPASVESGWVHYETGFAAGSKKTALPYLTHPSLRVPGYLSDLLHISSTDDIRSHFSRIKGD